MEGKENVTAGGGTNEQEKIDAGNQQGQEKTYTQADFDKALQSETDRRVNQALESAKAKWEQEAKERIDEAKSEAEKFAKMNAQERAKAEFEKERAEFEGERKKYNSERMKYECARTLADEGLPVGFAEILTGKTAEETKENITKFSDEFSKAVQAAVEQKLKGKTPETGPKSSEDDELVKGIRKGAGLK